MEKPAEEFDFDAMADTYDEDGAIEALSESLKPLVIVIEGRAVSKFPDGHVYRLPLVISIDDADALGSIEGDDPVRQVRELFSRLCGEKEAASLMAEPFQSVSAFAKRYFELFERVNKVTLGESPASPR